MEFISAVLSYFLVCTLLWALYQFRHISLLSPLTRGVKTLFKVVIFCLPRDLYRRIGGILDWILFSRHCLFQVLYLLLLLIGHVTLVNDVIAVLYRFGEAGNHVFTAFSCLFLNLASYALVCWSDPGYITSRNLPALANFFPYDNVLHTPRYCSDCLHLIPARAKHCGRCEQCIFRFEHHCVWTNCCIGGQNYVYFLGFLVTLVAMLANAVWQGVRLLSVFTRTHHLWDAQVVDFSGQLVAMHWSALVQLLATCVSTSGSLSQIKQPTSTVCLREKIRPPPVSLVTVVVMLSIGLLGCSDEISPAPKVERWDDGGTVVSMIGDSGGISLRRWGCGHTALYGSCDTDCLLKWSSKHCDLFFFYF